MTRKKPQPRVRDLEFAGYKFTSSPEGTVISRDYVDTKAPGDYGADPVGDGTFRMVPSGDIVDLEERNRRLKRRDNPSCTPCSMTENPRAKHPSAAEKAAHRIHYGVTYLLGYKATVESHNEPTRERWLVKVWPTYGSVEQFWVYDDHILGARRRYARKELYQGDSGVSQIVDEADAALEAVGPNAPYQVWREVDGARTLETTAYSKKEADTAAERIAKYRGADGVVTGARGRVLRRFSMAELLRLPPASNPLPSSAWPWLIGGAVVAGAAWLYLNKKGSGWNCRAGMRCTHFVKDNSWQAKNLLDNSLAIYSTPPDNFRDLTLEETAPDGSYHVYDSIKSAVMTDGLPEFLP